MKIHVWTKQHKAVLEQLERDGRYVAKRRYVQNDLGEQAEIMAKVYDVLVANHPKLNEKPEDAEVPVWVSFEHERTMMVTPDFVILELELDENLITKININKWGQVMNYGYLPLDKEDQKRHVEFMKNCGTSDAKAVMSNFYPELKREIVESWTRLFDDSVKFGSDASYGLIWEVTRDMLVNVEK